MDDLKSSLQQLQHGDAAQRAAAAEQISLSDDVAQAALALIDASADPDERVREWAVAGLESLESPAKADLNSLAERLRTSDAAIAYWAATLLGRIGTSATGAVGALASLAAQTDADLAARERAVWALGEIGGLTAEAESVLREVSDGDAPRLAAMARRALKPDRAAGETPKGH